MYGDFKAFGQGMKTEAANRKSGRLQQAPYRDAAVWRAAPLIALFFAICFLGNAGCSSNRFQLANNRERAGFEDFAGNPGYNAVPFQPPVASPPLMPAPGYAAAPAPVYGAAPGVPAVPGGYGAAAQPLPPLAQSEPLPLPVNPNPANTGVLNRRRLAATPRPGEPGSQLALEPDGPELVGRVVNAVGQPEARASIQVLDIARGRRVAAELASGTDGGFRVRHLEYGNQYELQAIASSGGERLVGSTIAVAPDTAVVIQVQSQDDNSPRAYSPLGNRLSTLASDSTGPGAAPRLGRPTAEAAVIPAAQAGGDVAVITPPLLGQSDTPSSPAMARPWGAEEPVGNRSRVAAPPAESPSWASVREPGRFPQPPALGSAPTSERSPALDTPSEPTSDRLPNRTALQTTAFAGTSLAAATAYTTTSMTKRPLGELPGDLILFDFFGSWCGPCRRAVPHLNHLHRRYASEGLRVIGVACEYGPADEAIATTERTRSELGIEYPLLVSPLEDESEFREYFRVEKYPTLVLIDRSGKVHFQAAGGDEATFDSLEVAIQKAIAGRTIN